MKIEIKFTNQKARQAMYALQQKYGIKHDLELSEKKLGELIKLNVLTVIAEQAQIDLERLEKLMPDILAQD